MPSPEDARFSQIVHGAVLVVLVVALLFVATKFGLMRCDSVPLWCDLYYSIAGAPKVLIVYGDDGLGNEQLLLNGLNEHVRLGGGGIVPITPSMVGVENIAYGNLKQFDLVIVTHAKTISTDNLKAFDTYVREGGRMVWTGDAGTVTEDAEEYLYEDDLDENKPHEIVDGGWARVDPDDNATIIYFGRDLLSAKFVGTYCEFKECEDSEPLVGAVTWFDDPLTQGLRQGIDFRRDFALVEKTESVLGGTKIAGSVKTNTSINRDGESLGRDWPLIIKTGPGTRVAYYALPPELYLEEGDDESGKWIAFLQNMFFGMIP